MRNRLDRTARGRLGSGDRFRPGRPVAAALLGLFGLASPLRAEHANIDLRLISPHDEVTAGADTEPPVGGLNPRPLLTVKAGTPLVFQFHLTNTYPHHVLKHVTVRYYVARTPAVDTKAPPPLTRDVVTRGAIVMNLKPQGQAGARLHLRAPKPGVYLVRVETRGTGSDHEHISAVNLKVE